MHFKTISDSNLAHYMSFADEMAVRNTVFSFKAISVERAGVKSVEDALQQLLFHMLVRGIEHEVETGRGPLPRALQLWKDQEELGRARYFLDKLGLPEGPSSEEHVGDMTILVSL